MPERTAYPHGTPSWTDLSTPDPAAALAFYGPLFGWTFEDNDAGEGNVYTMAKKGDAVVAGVMQQAPEQASMGIPAMWNSYVTVDDADAAVAKVEGAGGSVMVAPMDAMDAGRMAVVVDPAGAVICMWQPDQHVGAGLVNEHGTMCWNELTTPVPAQVAPFYAELFGWTAQDEDMGDGNVYTMFNLGDDGIGGAMPPMMEGIPPHWGVYFAVDDCDGCVARAAELGGAVIVEPMDIQPGRFAVLGDPTGAMFSVLQLSEPAT